MVGTVPFCAGCLILILTLILLSRLKSQSRFPFDENIDRRSPMGIIELPHEGNLGFAATRVSRTIWDVVIALSLGYLPEWRKKVLLYHEP